MDMVRVRDGQLIEHWSVAERLRTIFDRLDSYFLTNRPPGASRPSSRARVTVSARR
jgi:hypothetical protein